MRHSLGNSMQLSDLDIWELKKVKADCTAGIANKKRLECLHWEYQVKGAISIEKWHLRIKPILIMYFYFLKKV